MRFLITGTAGFIGFHLAQRLLDAGHFVTGLDGMTSYYDVALKRARLQRLERTNAYLHVEGMLENRAALDQAAAEARADIIIHLAAQAGVRYSIEAPRTYVDSNLVGTWNVLELARELQPAHLLIASTSSVYGASPKVPFSETDRTDQPLSLYAATKKGTESIAHSYAHLFEIPTTMLRFFTVYGPWGRPDMALFKFVRAICGGAPIDVYGHGEMARDFTFIDDVVESIVRLVPLAPVMGARLETELAEDSLSDDAPYRIVNIANGAPVRLMDFISVIEDVLGRKAQFNFLDMQPGDVPQTFGDARLLHALTGYCPEVRVEAGVAAFVKWYRDLYG